MQQPTLGLDQYNQIDKLLYFFPLNQKIQAIRNKGPNSLYCLSGYIHYLMNRH